MVIELYIGNNQRGIVLENVIDLQDILHIFTGGNTVVQTKDGI